MNIHQPTCMRAAWFAGLILLLNTSLAVTQVYATTINFTGTLGVIEIDNGSSIYSGLSVGDTFSGSITYGNSAADATFVDIESPTSAAYVFIGVLYGGYITDASDGSIVTVGETSEVDIRDNDIIGSFDAELINNLLGAGSISDVTIVDSWGVANDSSAPGFGVTLISLDTSLYSGLDFQVLPPTLADSDFAGFFIEEEDEDDNLLYLATGILDSITVVPDPTVGCGTTLTADTILDSDMVCGFNALIMNTTDNITLDCAGHSITTTGRSFPSIFVSDVTGVTIKNCNIITDTFESHSISLNRVNNSTISNNTISTLGDFSHGINVTRSSGNSIINNTIAVGGPFARAIRLRTNSLGNTVSGNDASSALSHGLSIRIGADNNTVSQNSFASGTSHAVAIRSASGNQFTGNTFISSDKFVRVLKQSIQNGGLSVDNAGTVFAVENRAGNGGKVVTMFQVDDPNNTGVATSNKRLTLDGLDLTFGFDSLDILPDGLEALATRGSGSNQLYSIDLTSGVVTLVFPREGIDFPAALAGSKNGLHVIDDNTTLATTNQGELVRIDTDPITGIITETVVGQDGGGWTGLSKDPASPIYYAVSRWSAEPSSTSHLYEINPLDGQIIREIGDIGIAFLSDIDFSPGGVLYGNSFSGFLMIDTATGEGTLINDGYGPDPFESPSLNNRLTDQTFSAPSASVQFLEPIDLPGLDDLKINSTAIKLEQNSIFVDSTLFPFLQGPARLTLANLGGTSRNLLVDPEDDGTFEPCLSLQCTLVSFTGGTLIFDVAGFTTYSSEVNENPTVESVVPVVLAEIDALLIDPGVSDKAMKKLSKSQKKLAKALDQLEKGDVKKALKEIGKAVKELLKAEKEGADVADLIDLLAESSRAEAQDAIDAAIAAGGKPKDIDKAQAEMVKAQNKLDKGKPDKAIDHYRRAWEKAQKAVSGGGVGSDPGPIFLNGTVASGAPVVGIVNVLGANGLSASSLIESDGSYSIDVTLLTPPFILFAEGSVNGRSLTMYSAAVAAGTINITPITDFILRNALAGTAEAAYTGWASSQVNAADLIAAETNAQQQIQPVLSALAIASDVDLVSTPFSADLTGIDLLLEVLTISYSGSVATVANNLSGSSFTDDFTVTSDNSNALPAADASVVTAALTDQQAINSVFQILEDLYATSVPTAMQLNTFAPFVADDFLEEGRNKTQLLDELAIDGPPIGFTLDAVIDRVMDVSATLYLKGYWVRVYFDDGVESDSFLTSMVFNGVNWLWYGDRKWVETGISGHAFMFIFEAFPTSFGTGYEFGMDDDLNYAYNQGVRSAIVTGPGLPTSGLIFEHRFPETGFAIYLDPFNGVFHPVADDAVLSVIQDNAEYVFNLCPESAADLFNSVATCTAVHTQTNIVMKPPVLNSELNASMFASLVNPSSHDSLDVNFGGLINVDWVSPANTTSAGVNLAWDNMGTRFDASAEPLLGDTSVTLDTIGLPAPGVGEFASIFIRVTDMHDRDFNMGWTFF